MFVCSLEVQSFVDSLHTTVENAKENWESLKVTEPVMDVEQLSKERIKMKHFLLAILKKTIVSSPLQLSTQVRMSIYRQVQNSLLGGRGA